MIAIIAPTRGRPKQFQRMVESVKSTSKKAMIYAASNGSDDYVSYHYPIDMPTVFMWNDMAKMAMKEEKNKLFMLAADDIIFSTKGWDEALIDHYSKLERKIHCWALQDSRDKEGFPHPIVSREWIEAMNWFVPPYFMHWKIDVWTNEIAKTNNCFTHMRDYLLVHDKPNDRGQPDETHSRIRRNGWLQRDDDMAKSCAYLLEYEKKRLAEKMQ